jgi:hypothetical protein
MQRLYEENAAESEPRRPVADFARQPAPPLEFGDDSSEKCLTFPGGVGTYTGTFKMTAVEGLLAR